MLPDDVVDGDGLGIVLLRPCTSFACSARGAPRGGRWPVADVVTAPADAAGATVGKRWRGRAGRAAAEVVDGWSVAHVSVLHHSLVLERLEDPVHGGLGDIGVVGLDGGGEVLGGDMARSVEEGGDDDSALDSGSKTLGAQGRKDVVQLRGGHELIVRAV